MPAVETTWKLLFDGPQGFRLVVEYHSNARPEQHEAEHRKLVDIARRLLALRPEVLGKPVRLVPVQLSANAVTVHEAVPLLETHREKG